VSLHSTYVKLTINSTWGGVPQSGLSEVRFLYIPVKARLPEPAADANDQQLDVAANWRPGREAASHKVYLSTDRQAVADVAPLVGTVNAHRFDFTALDLATTYYWRVDEVNDAMTPNSWQGDVWAFTTKQYQIIDDFESYTNDSPNRVFQTWVDGAGFSPDEFFPKGGDGNGSNSPVGYEPPDITEVDSVHSGGQAMPAEYNNVAARYYSEIPRTWTTPQDWTTNGAAELSLWFQDRPATLIGTDSAITLRGAGADIYQGTAEFRFACKKLSGDGSITVRIDSVQTLGDWTKAGVMIRESLEPLAVQVHMISAAQLSLVEFMYRDMTNSQVTTQSNTAANTNPLPVWLKITRLGNTFTGALDEIRLYDIVLTDAEIAALAGK